MNSFFHIRFEFDKKEILQTFEKHEKGYICVADGTVMRYAHKDMDYRRALDGALFSISDSSWTPMFLKWIYDINVQAYPGPQLFLDIIKKKKYRMAFMGGNKDLLEALKNNLSDIDPTIADMFFFELPFCNVEDFDYQQIAQKVNEFRPDIVWVSLGAPKQELFVSKLNPFLNKGILVSVGAAFSFYSNLPGTKRAPEWMQRAKLEFFYRMIKEPRKQWGRFLKYLVVLPSIILEELNNKRRIETVS